MTPSSLDLDGRAAQIASKVDDPVQRQSAYVEALHHLREIAGILLSAPVIPKEVPLPVTPLYDLKIAAQLVPMTLNGLRSYLRTHRDEFPPPVYRQDNHKVRHRLLSAEDIARVRAGVLRGPGVDHYAILRVA